VPWEVDNDGRANDRWRWCGRDLRDLEHRRGCSVDLCFLARLSNRVFIRPAMVTTGISHCKTRLMISTDLCSGLLVTGSHDMPDCFVPGNGGGTEGLKVNSPCPFGCIISPGCGHRLHGYKSHSTVEKCGFVSCTKRLVTISKELYRGRACRMIVLITIFFTTVHSYHKNPPLSTQSPSSLFQESEPGQNREIYLGRKNQRR